MALDERSRHELYLRLEETLGPEAATTLMEHLPPVGWADVATKHDLDQTAALLRSDLDQTAALLRSDLDRTAALLRSDLDQTAALLRSDLDRFADRMTAEFGNVRAEFYREFAHQTRNIVLANIGAFVAVATLAFGAARLN